MSLKQVRLTAIFDRYVSDNDKPLIRFLEVNIKNNLIIPVTNESVHLIGKLVPHEEVEFLADIDVEDSEVVISNIDWRVGQ